MFKITRGKGFHVKFENGYTVSVQFGSGNYCENYNGNYDDSPLLASKGSCNAECAVWPEGGDMIKHELFEGDAVGAEMTPSQVLDLMNWAASQKK